jgi:putative aldouronate transport system permease protein
MSDPKSTVKYPARPAARDRRRGSEPWILRFAKELRRNRDLFLIMLPAFVFILVNNYLPMGGIIVAFKQFNYADGIFSSPWNGLEKILFLFQSDAAATITVNTLSYNLVFMGLSAVVGIVFAVILNELRSRRLAKLYQTVMFLPYFLSWMVVSYLVYALLHPEYGFVNTSILPVLNIAPFEWYAEPRAWPPIIVSLNIWKYAGYNTILYLASITAINRDLYEAAVIDGAGKGQQAWRITIPMLKPIIFITTLIALGNIFRADFGLFYLVPLNSGPLFSVTDVLDTYIFRGLLSSSGGSDIGMAAAAGLYQSVVGFAFVLSANWAAGRITRGENRLF